MDMHSGSMGVGAGVKLCTVFEVSLLVLMISS